MPAKHCIPDLYRSILALSSVFMLIACGEKVEITEQAAGPRPVKLVTVNQSNVQADIRYPAVIDASDRADIGFQVGGLIEELPFNQASRVKKGDVLARLNDRDLKSQLNSAQAAYDKDNSDYNRAATLIKKGAISKSELDQRKTQRDISKAKLETAQKALEDTVLTAPFSGVIAALPVTRLQNVSAGENILSLVNLSQLKATIQLPASVMAKVSENSNRSAILRLDSDPAETIEATFKEASLVADTASQTYAVTFEFSSPDNRLVLPGMNATIIVKPVSTATVEDTVSVPLSAIQSEGDAQYVWKFDTETQTVTKKSIQVDSDIGEFLSVSGELVAGDQIVGAGASYLAEGLHVVPWVQ